MCLKRSLSPTILVSHDFWRQIFAHAFLSYLYCCSKASFYEVKELWLLTNIDLFWNKKVKNEKIYSQKYIHRKTPVIESFYSEVGGLKVCSFKEKGLHLRCFCEICEVLQNLIFTEDSWVKVSNFQQHFGHITYSISNKST